MKLLKLIKLLAISAISICAFTCIEAVNESTNSLHSLQTISIDNNSSLTTTTSNTTALNSSLANASNTTIASSSLAIPTNTSSDTVLSDPLSPLSEHFINSNRSFKNNSQENTVTKNCFESVCNENIPKVLVTQKSRTTISIAFDDFKLPNYESGYVVQYRQFYGHKPHKPLNSDTNQNNSTFNRNQIQANNTPFVTIKDLRPNTPYEIQVLVWEDIDSKKLGLGSEIVTVSTEDGCFRNNTSYAVGEEFFDGCSLRCICRTNSKEDCSQRCVPPLVTIGSFKSDPKCTETTSDEDICCASVLCVNDPLEGRSNEAAPAFTGKPGYCPNSIDGKDGENCQEECSHDYHCTGLKKCCQNICGGTSCVSPVAKQVSCENVTCGQNAFCQIEDNSHSCRCRQGFTGDPNDRTGGCVKNPSLMCFYKDSHYSPGQTFNDSCQLCLCSEALEVECNERCVHKSIDLVPSDCTLVKDPNDECCKIVDCETGITNTTSIIDMKHTVSEHNTTHYNTSHLKPIDGCLHNNKTYKESESFFIECQLKCLCQTHGRVQCVPRCALDPGFDENFCRLVTDPDDPECCKIAVCDKRDVINDKPEILIDSAEAFNSTSVKLRVMIPNLKNGILGSTLKLLYSVVSINETESEKDNDSRDWKTIDVSEEAIKVIATDIYEVDIGGLVSQTDYLMKVLFNSTSSNTVFVRTYPPGIDITFNGCFHGNQTIEVGQVFYEGDCEYKCVCREGGLRECEERCPVYIDSVGYENCDWGPAPDDSCCTVPICDNKNNKKNTPEDPDAEPFCVSEGGKVYKIGQSWDTGTNCLKKSCQCALLPNGTTGIQCKGGCATLPANARQPSEQCPSPQIVQPDDPCICPYVVCHNNMNPLDLPEKPSSPRNKQFCEFKGRKIAIGEEIYDNCRAVCHCGPDAQLNCAAIECPHNFAPHVSDCLEWDIDPLFTPIAPNCCPQPKCKNDGSCSFAGIRFPNFKHIPQELLPCGTRCVCVKGKVDCENRCPSVPDIPPPHMPCPPSMAYRGHLPGDNCCLHWLCREQEKSTNHCSHNGKRYKLGEQWDEKGQGVKKRCQCSVTNGLPHVQCHPGGCPQITDRFLQPTLDCPHPTIVIPDDPVVLCPYVICNDSKDSGRDLEHVNIVAINATSARIRFTLPSLLVGLIGHAELHYTTDLNIPRSQWNIQKFARPKRLFDTPNIEYHLGNLSPDTTYFFQIQVIIEALQSGPESEVYKLYLPPIPSSASTSTTTTTVPPMIMLDVGLTAVSNDYKTLKISWRQFSPQEKKFIDGIQIRYKNAERDQNEWKTTQVLHRDVRSHVLRDLEPGVSYAVDLLFISNPDISTHIISTKPIVIDMPSPPKDLFDIQVSLHPNDINVDSLHTIIKLNDLPVPINKYINVAKISYRSEDSMELMHTFKDPDGEGRLVLDGLKPSRRYKAWIDLYLTNGKTVSSNAIEFTTKERPIAPKIDNKIDTSANEAEALRENEVMDGKYLYCLVIVSVFAAVTAIGFVVVLYFLLRKQSSAKAPITRAPSESAYDNPTYKTYEVTERTTEENMKNGTIQA